MTILDNIVEQKRREVALLPEEVVTPQTIREAIDNRGGLRDFAAALRKPAKGCVALIAEVKKASPSAGVICANFDPESIARQYKAAGASCLSVLTDEKFFQGSLTFLRQIRAAVDLPLLRKDFIIDPRQILEAARWGADAILLIAAILSDEQIAHFHGLARASGLAALVEVHDADELQRVLALGVSIVGVNNRNLKNFKVDLATTESLAALLPKAGRPVLVSASGIHTRADVERVERAGAQAILVGESLVRSGNIARQIETLLS